MLHVFLMVCLLDYAQTPPAIISKVDSLERVVEQAAHDTSRVKALREWNQLIYPYDPQQDMELLLEIQFTCEVNLEEAITAKERSFYERELRTCLNSLGVMYASMGDYSESLDHHFQALRMAGRSKDRKMTARSLNNIGAVYRLLENPDSAMSNFVRAYEIAQQVDSTIMAQALANISGMQMDQGEYEKSIENFFQCLNLFEQRNENGEYDLDIASIYNYIGTAYLYQGNHRKSFQYLKIGLKITEEVGSPSAIALLQLSIGAYFQSLGDLDEAIRYNVLALMNANSVGQLETEEAACKKLYELHKENGNYAAALKYHEKSVVFRDSISREESNDFALRKNMVYEFDKRTLRDSLNHAKDLSMAEEKEEWANVSRKWTIYTSIFALGLLLIFVWIIQKRLKISRKQTVIIESQKSQIVESIEYSRQIQQSMLPPIEELEAHFSQVFLFYDPKDIVSGDFYWFKDLGDRIVLSVVDCTGHGVPGGFMSTLGSLLMDKIILDQDYSPSEILERMSDELIRVLHQDKDGAIQDGMDMSICLIDKKQRTIHFAGARNGLLVFENGEFRKYKADLLPVGGNYTKKGKPIERSFRNEEIQVGEDAWVIMYTDGYIEQIGPEGLPMNSDQYKDRLRKALEKEASEDIVMVSQIELARWQGLNERNDDVCIIGFKL